MKELEIIKKLLPFLRIYPWAATSIVILGVTSSLAEGLGISLLIPFLGNLDDSVPSIANDNPFLSFLDRLLSGFDTELEPFIIAGFIFTAILLKVMLIYLYTIQMGWLNSRITHRLRHNVFAQMMSLPQQFWNKVGGGELLNTLNQETSLVGSALNHLIWLTTNLCMIVTFTVVLLFISWQLTLFAALVLMLISLLIRYMTRQGELLGQRSLAAGIKLQQTSLEAITGILTIRAFGHELYEQKRFEQASKQARDISFQLQRLSALIEPVSEGLAVLLLVGLMLFTLWAQLSLPVLVTMIFMLYRLQPQVKQFDTNRNFLLTYNSSVDKLNAFLNPADKPYILSGCVPYTNLKHGIVFESVSFGYSREDKLALNNVSIKIRRGETTAFVGPSGAGKSTLISLICRFYDVTNGQIKIDDQPLPSLKLSDWRSSIALVSQDIHIFNTSVGDNIAYGRIGCSEAEVIAAAKQANAHQFICDLPQGYDTFVGDRGVRLSGGQRQRIAIARAILRNPDILILDEATNALDSLSEDLIQETLYRLSQNRTVLVIAHRLSTIENADQIVVLEQGCVRECGTFDELFKRQGLFAQMYQLQHKKYV